MNKVHASFCCRVLCAIERQIQEAFLQGRDEDAAKMSRIFGGLQYAMFETSCARELGDCK